MTDAPGTYALLLRGEENQEIEVGALGAMIVRPGVYVYVGSAFGPGGLRARVGRHARGDGAQHWHVDYLRAATALEAVWYTHDPERRECTWAAVLRDRSGATVPVDGFGASDCTCPAHLTRFESVPSLSSFRARLREQYPDHAPVEQAGEDLLE
ncbi:GIY-YIG nuclease family protein [Salinibacter sp.]|uniref:GIY-YIG nuclease family protein n=1 Tax=Salinibacter sp. TaxID=2065818 RepID=UPI0021E91D61|nr:GIY-YIG nuclease family protein [Salinibacter sp.]